MAEPPPQPPAPFGGPPSNEKQQHSTGEGAAPPPVRAGERGEAGSGAEKRTLTNLYNQRPTWLDNAHRKLDEAVFAAYGWPSDLSVDEILARLLALNLERAGK